MAETIDTQERSAFSGWPMVVGWLAMIVFALHSSTHMVGAGDTWVALACGRHFLNHGVNTVEPFSANSHKPGPTEQDIKKWPPLGRWVAEKVGLKTTKYWHPTGWINQNWLTHVIFYWLSTKSPVADAQNYCFNTLVYWKFVIYILTVICVYYTGRILGANPALCAFFACAAMFIGRSFLDIRPAGFSNLLVAVFLLVLTLATYRNVLYIWLIVPITVFWCNVHGGYIYVFIMLVPFVAFNFLTLFLRNGFISIGLRGIYHTITAGLVAFVSMIVLNPFHLTNLTHTFVISISKHAKMWRNVHEWHPAFEWQNPVGTGFPFLVLLILSIGMVVFWLFSRILKPRLLKAPVNELKAQEKLFGMLSKTFAWATAMLLGWVIFIGFSFLNLDVLSFFFCAVFVVILLLSASKSVHFIYLTVFLTLLAMWTAESSKGYSGRYIYPFLTVPAYVTVRVFVSIFSEKAKTKKWDIVFVTATAAVSLLLMSLIFNPFKFSWPSWNPEREHGFWAPAMWLFDWLKAWKQMFHLQRPWRPMYEGKDPLNYTHLFTVLYVLNILSILISLAIPYFKKIVISTAKTGEPKPPAKTYQLPKIDVALMVIAALTVYMAIRSRRFIPIAAIATCPILAMFVDHMTRTISAAHNFYKHKSLTVPPMPHNVQLFFTVTGACAVLAFGTWWGLKFKHIYLDPWPTDPKFSSVFMRMTASHAKPFYACQFIKLNSLKGIVFNYWTEGGFIAWGQQPDPNTGRTPLQLFMDGRAQAAYEPEAFQVWTEIMSGVPEVFSARMRRQKVDYKKVGTWIDKQLKDRQVWVILMPALQFNTPFVIAIERNPNWRLVFFNNKQKLFVDVTTPQGMQLFKGIFTGKTLYPDEFSRTLMLAHNMLFFVNGNAAKQKGLDLAIRALQLNPSQTTMREVVFAARFPELRARVEKVCKDYFEDFVKNKSRYMKEDGYHDRLVAAFMAADRLASIEREKDPELAKFCAAKSSEYKKEREAMLAAKMW